MSEEVRCACPCTDRVDCVRSRYGYSREEALSDPCDCACHDDEEGEE